MMFGESKESGFWLAKNRQYKFMFANHDALYIAVGIFRLRVMK